MVWDGYSGWMDSCLGREGVWLDLESIDLWIPNHTEPNEYKEIWLQVTYHVTDLQPPAYIAPTVEVPGATYLGGQIRILEENLGLWHWELSLSKWRIEPNPTEEWIHLTWPEPGEYPRGAVDQIVVDTICIPEPGTMALLALGACAAVPRRAKIRRRGRT